MPHAHDLGADAAGQGDTMCTAATAAPTLRKLGIDACTSCGEPVALVGALRSDGCCHVCGLESDRTGALINELRRAVGPWVRACIARGVDALTIAELWECAGYEALPVPDGVRA
jgi:hypothetical protein